MNAIAGKELARLHIEYETLKPYPLKFVEAGSAHGEKGAHRGYQNSLPLSYRVDSKMRLSKDKTALAVNDSLTLSGIPAEAQEYRLGNRSALEWVIDQYRVAKDDNGNITSDPNRLDDEEYIVRLIGQVVTVSLETMKVVKSLPSLEFRDP